MEAITQTAAKPVEPSIVDSAVELKPKAEEILEDKAKDLSEGELAKEGMWICYQWHKKRNTY